MKDWNFDLEIKLGARVELGLRREVEPQNTF
jgi:hypothetical protein